MARAGTTMLHAKAALLPQGWAQDVRLTITGDTITSIESGIGASADDERHDVLVPAMPNLHSHAFQRAMAGLAENRGPGEDSFWSWRTIMYRLALSMTPDQMEAVAAQLYMEMLEAGFSRVGEFHYLHHDRDGRAYANPAEMAERLAAAANETGIGLTLLPVFYAHSGFGGQPPVDGQRRFINSLDSYGRLMEGCEKLVSGLPNSNLGVAPHSLRAVVPEELSRVVAMAKGGPVHIHVAEQTKEVEDCLAWSGARPVQWLLANAPVDDRWCLIHATHMTESEAAELAFSDAVAGLCPITEANLGDGVFPAPGFLEKGGRIGIGSDSNILISISEELRQLEYSQRINLRARNVIAEPSRSTGQRLFERVIAGGAAALNVSAGLATGNPADILSLDTRAVPYLPVEKILDNWIFAGGAKVEGAWVAGNKQVEGGRHKMRDAINRRFLAVMQELMAD